MPETKQTPPPSTRSRITTWLQDNPGHHRPRDIAAGLGVPTHRTKSQWTIDVGRECSRMSSTDLLTKRGGTYGAEYALITQPAPTS